MRRILDIVRLNVSFQEAIDFLGFKHVADIVRLEFFQYDEVCRRVVAEVDRLGLWILDLQAIVGQELMTLGLIRQDFRRVLDLRCPSFVTPPASTMTKRERDLLSTGRTATYRSLIVRTMARPTVNGWISGVSSRPSPRSGSWKIPSWRSTVARS